MGIIITSCFLIPCGDFGLHAYSPLQALWFCPRHRQGTGLDGWDSFGLCLQNCAHEAEALIVVAVAGVVPVAVRNP